MISFSKFAPIAAVVMTLAMSTPLAIAHDDAYLDSQKSSNGGQVRMAGIYHVELVLAKDSKSSGENQVLVYVTDHAGAKIPTIGASATATILSGKVKSTATLVPDGENRLKGTAKYSATPDLKVVVSVVLAGKSPEQARFTPFAMAHEASESHKH